MDTSPSLTTPYTLWSGLIGGMFLALSYFGCDQSQVQRYLSGRSLTQSRLSLLFNAFLKVPMQFLILLTGVLVFVFYHFQPPPLLWNRVEMRGWSDAAAGRARGAAGALRGRARRAQAAAERYAAPTRERRRARRSATAPPSAALDAAPRRGRARWRARSGESPTTTPTTSSRPTCSPACRRSRRPGDRGDLRGRDVHPVRRVQLARHRLDGRLLPALRAPEAAPPTTLGVARCSPRFWGVFACLVALQAGRLGSASRW